MSNTESRNQPTHDDIAARAYQLWEAGGRKPGHDQEYWYQAIAHLSARASNSTSSLNTNSNSNATANAVFKRDGVPASANPEPKPESAAPRKRKSEGQTGARRQAALV